MLNKNLAKWLLLLFLLVVVVLISSPGSPWRRTVVVFSFLMALTDVLAPQVSGICKLPLVIPVWTQDQFAGAIASIGGAVAYLSKSSGTLGRSAWFVIPLWRFQRSGDPTATEMKITRHFLAVMKGAVCRSGDPATFSESNEDVYDPPFYRALKAANSDGLLDTR